MKLFFAFKNFVTKLIQTLATVLKVLIKSKFNLVTSDFKNKDYILLANGPSLLKDIEKHKSIFIKKNLITVNNSFHSEYYFHFKPSTHFLLDPVFFFENEILESVKKSQHLIFNSIDWKIDFHVPFSSRKSTFVKKLISQPNFTVYFFNNTPAIGGFNKVNYFLYNKNIASPQFRNILNVSIFELVKGSANTIFLFGAENNWHNNITVNQNNLLVFKDNHFYKKEKSESEIILYIDKNKEHGLTMANLFSDCLKNFIGYENIQKYALKKQVKIYNCSKNSSIDAFERLNDDEFIEKQDYESSFN